MLGVGFFFLVCLAALAALVIWYMTRKDKL